MFLSGKFKKSEVENFIKKSNAKSKTKTYSAKFVVTKLGPMWKIYVKPKNKKKFKTK